MSVSHAYGVRFCLESNCWKPLPSCGQQSLPRELPPEASPFVLRRQLCADVQHVRVQGIMCPFVSEQGFMLGPDCAPNVAESSACTQCKRAWSLARRVSSGQFLLRTYVGTVLRLVFQYVCDCGATMTWDPSSEYIYTIRNGTEGGEQVNVVAHKKLIFIVLLYLNNMSFIYCILIVRD
jgi:hypothetical protein